MASKIEWTNETWNPVTGCTKVSAGCKNCYAEVNAKRFWGDRKFTDVQCHDDRLEQPLHWKKPRMIFVNSVSDLFHPDVPFEFIDKVWTAMGCTKHIYQILTKRPERMLQYFQSEVCKFNVEIGLEPLKNIWLGVSVENQETADERIPLLIKTPAIVKWISAEPLLGEIDLTNIPIYNTGALHKCNSLQGYGGWGNYNRDKYKLDWIVCGGESGPAARPMHPDWARSIKDQCQAAGVPFFFKQWGNFIPLDYIPTYKDKDLNKIYAVDEYGVLSSASFIFAYLRVSFHKSKKDEIKKYMWVKKLGKKKAGNLLDNKQYLEYPKGE